MPDTRIVLICTGLPINRTSVPTFANTYITNLSDAVPGTRSIKENRPPVGWGDAPVPAIGETLTAMTGALTTVVPPIVKRELDDLNWQELRERSRLRKAGSV